MSHVFISYVRQNRRLVDRLAKELRDNGVTVWLDRNNLQAGERWQIAIRKAIHDGKFFIACFSTQYENRDVTNMGEELTIAVDELRKRKEETKWFIPVLINKTRIPSIRISDVESINSINFVYLYRNWRVGVDSILKAVGVGLSTEEIAAWPKRRDLQFFGLNKLALMVWRNLWERRPLKGLQLVQNANHLKIMNSANLHSHSKVIVDHDLEGDFQAKLTLRGLYQDIQLQISNGKDQNFNCNPSFIGIDTKATQTYIIKRIGSRISFAVAEGGSFTNLNFQNWNTEPRMRCFVAIVIPNGESIDLFEFSLSEPERTRPFRSK